MTENKIKLTRKEFEELYEIEEEPVTASATEPKEISQQVVTIDEQIEEADKKLEEEFFNGN